MRRSHFAAKVPPLVAAVAALLVLGGCTSGTDGGSPSPATSGPAASSAVPSASPSAAPSASPSWSGTATLTPEELRAFQEATQAVLAYRQTIVDLYSGARTDLNDMYLVATGDMLDQNLRQMQAELGKGHSVDPAGAQLRLVSAAPIRMDLSRDAPTVELRACIDATGLNFTASDGTRRPGVQEQLDYTVVGKTQTDGWAVSRVQGANDLQERKC